MTERLVVWIGRQALDYTFAAVAEQVGVDEKTVRNIFTEYAAKLQAKFKRETPVILGMDEIYLGTARGVITNIGERTVVDMLENRYKTTILAFLRSLDHPERITNAFTESFNAKIRRAYQNGHGYSFEVLRAKILFSDALQKRMRVAEQVKAKRKPRFEEVQMVRVFMELVTHYEEPEYDTKTVTRLANIGTDLTALLGEMATWQPRISRLDQGG